MIPQREDISEGSGFGSGRRQEVEARVGLRQDKLSSSTFSTNIDRCEDLVGRSGMSFL